MNNLQYFDWRQLLMLQCLVWVAQDECLDMNHLHLCEHHTLHQPHLVHLYHHLHLQIYLLLLLAQSFGF